ncbi:MAG: acetylglutamate kinase [bacterium]|jgi:acetylglutamate kinase
MQRAIAKADVLIEALPYIQDFRNAIIVVKFGGSAMEERRNVENILADVTFMECVGMKPVLVHGGGKAISKAMTDAGLQPQFVRGLRVTDEATIKVVETTIRDKVNASLLEILNAKGAKAKRIDGNTIFEVEKRTVTDPTTGEVLDWGYVGEIKHVHAAPILECLRNEIIPVITPLGNGPDGKLYNLNADDAAAAVARELRARKLAFLSDVPGLLKDRTDDSTLLSTLHIKEVEELIASKVIDGGMLPKIKSCMEALAAGVRKIHIIDGRLPHSLLLEIFTEQGVGTEIIE